MLSIIAAVSNNNVIGFENGIPWNLPNDREMFKKSTLNHVIIMGRKTFESIGNPLPHRKSIVFTKNKDYKIDDENVKIVHSISEIKQWIMCEEEVFVIRRSRNI